MPKQTPETRIDQQVVEILSMYGSQANFWKNKADKYSPNGLADITLCLNGQHFEIETKAGNSHKLGLNQLFFGFKCIQAGGIFIVAYPDFMSIDPLNGYDTRLNDLPSELATFKSVNELPKDIISYLTTLAKDISNVKESVFFKVST